MKNFTSKTLSLFILAALGKSLLRGNIKNVEIY